MSLPGLWLCTSVLALSVLLVRMAMPAAAAITEPRLALMRVTSYRSASGSTTLKLEGSFSFADAVQLALPLNVTATQGQLSARFDLSGNVFTTMAGGAEQPASGPGVIGVVQREITLVLPAGFTAGEAMAQVIATFENRPIASNRLGFLL